MCSRARSICIQATSGGKENLNHNINLNKHNCYFPIFVQSQSNTFDYHGQLFHLFALKINSLPVTDDEDTIISHSLRPIIINYSFFCRCSDNSSAHVMFSSLRFEYTLSLLTSLSKSKYVYFDYQFWILFHDVEVMIHIIQWRYYTIVFFLG